MGSLRRLVLIILLGIHLHPASAYVPTSTSSGVPIRWKAPVKLNLAGNPRNQIGLDPGDFNSSVVLGLQRWKAASGDMMNFDYWQGSDNSIFIPLGEYNGYSNIYFSSNSSSSALSSNILGLTQVWYNTNTGEILETDIVLNDLNFHFTNNPLDTSGYGSGGSTTTDGKSNVYIQNVITHELGHALGLSHSGGLQSTMLFMESPEQAHLGCDEQIAIHAIYPGSDQFERGNITGTVVSDSGAPVFGAHVLAISQVRGAVLATAITNRGGQYALQALEPGSYYLMVEPFYAGPQALPAYFSESTSAICPDGASFGRGFFFQNGSFELSAVTVGAGGETAVPTLVAHCNGSGGADVEQNPSAGSPHSAPVVYSGVSNSGGFGIADRLKLSKSSYYKLSGLSGRLEVHAMSYSIYSPLHPRLTLYTTEGNMVGAKILDPSYTGDSGYVNHDSFLKVDALPWGDYYLEVRASRMDANDYPAGPISLDRVPFLVLIGSNNAAAPPLAGLIPDNARCRMEEQYPPYSSPLGNPPKTGGNESGGGGLCGTVRDSNSDRPGAIFGWFLPWVFMLAFTRLAIRLQSALHPANLRRWGSG